MTMIFAHPYLIGLYLLLGLAFYAADFKHVQDVTKGETVPTVFLLAVIVPTWPFWLAIIILRKIID